jgi:glutaredoxin
MSREDLYTVTGGRSVPQIVIDGKSIGGYDDMMALEAGGELGF